VGKGGAKQQVTKFYMSQHFGICAAADRLKRIVIKEKDAWTGSLTDQTKFSFRDDDLFGGITKEGGATGAVYWLPGKDDQVLPDELAIKLGRSGGADCPGYRGIASAFFTGSDTPTPGTDGRPGFFWTANTPYLPGVWIEVERAPVGLDPAIALIPRTADSLTIVGTRYRYFKLNVDTSSAAGVFDLIEWEMAAFAGGPDRVIGAAATASTPSGGQPVSCVVDGYYHTGPFESTTLPAWIKIDLGTGNALSPAEARFYINPYSGGYAYPTRFQILGSNDDVTYTELGNWDSVVMGAGANIFPLPGGEIPVPGAGDANPAHIIYECLTNTDWGMGSPETGMDFGAFSACATTLYNENFGLSMIWVRQTEIESFVQEVLDHIQAVLFVDPSTGLLTLKLIRADYDEAKLPVITPDNADLTNFGRKLWGDIANEIVVTWTNPASEQDETVTAHDLASIVTQGVVTDSRNYYGVRSAALAARLAARDLRSSGAPLATCECEVDRTQWRLRPASVLKVEWPEYGLAGVVMRVTDIDYGKAGDPTIKLKLLEDVFGLDAGDYVTPPSSSWEDPSTPPARLTIERVFTLPYFMANEQADLTAAGYPEVLAGILGTTDASDTFNYDLWSDVTLSNGSTEWQALATNNVIGHSTLTADLAAEATSTGVGFDTIIGKTAPTVSGFVLIGDDGEDGNEFALIDATGATYTLRRGVLDTVPRAWPAGTPVWFVDGSTIFEDPTTRSSGEVVEYKLLSRTSKGLLALAFADLVTYTLTDRPWQPSRPANVQVSGVRFNTALTPVDMRTRTDPWVTISWANRNRLTEDSQILAWTDASVTPETGQTTTVEVLSEDLGTVLATHTGLTGTSYNVPDADFAGHSIVFIRASASRTDADGTFTNLQAHGLFVQVGSLSFDETDVSFDDDTHRWDEN
jgi:hypothetical protein